MDNNVRNLTLYRSLKQLKAAVQDLNKARKELYLSETALEASNQKLSESVEHLNEQTTKLKAIAAESETLEKWIEAGDYSTSPFLPISLLIQKTQK